MHIFNVPSEDIIQLFVIHKVSIVVINKNHMNIVLPCIICRLLFNFHFYLFHQLLRRPETSFTSGVYTERLKLVGPDCACAEWLLRNGASVLFKGHTRLLSDYNELIKLEEIEASHLKVEEIYARKTYLNSAGFDHLKDCNHVKKITLIFCTHIGDSALFKLSYVKNSLQYLEIRSCFNVKDEGLIALCDLRNLKTLILEDLVSVKNKDQCENTLRKSLPQCKIDFQK